MRLPTHRLPRWVYLIPQLPQHRLLRCLPRPLPPRLTAHPKGASRPRGPLFPFQPRGLEQRRTGRTPHQNRRTRSCPQRCSRRQQKQLPTQALGAPLPSLYGALSTRAHPNRAQHPQHRRPPLYGCLQARPHIPIRLPVANRPPSDQVQHVLPSLQSNRAYWQ